MYSTNVQEVSGFFSYICSTPKLLKCYSVYAMNKSTPHTEAFFHRLQCVKRNENQNFRTVLCERKQTLQIWQLHILLSFVNYKNQYCYQAEIQNGFIKQELELTRAFRSSLFLNNLWGLGTEQEQGCRTCPPGFIGWRNRFLGSLNVYKFGLWVSFNNLSTVEVK